MNDIKTKKTEPGTVINAALCSFGMSGRVFHAPFIDANPGFNLWGVLERNAKKATGIYPGIKSYDSLDEMLAEESINLVVVNTPTYTHFEFAKKALQAGKHVLVEKAFTVTVQEALELVEIAKSKKLVLSVFHNRRYDSDFKTVKKILDEKLMGEVIEAEFHFDRYKPELSPKKHKETALPGAGLLHDLGPHIIDQALYLFGMPVSVFGNVRKVRKGSLVNDYFDITLFYETVPVRIKASLLVKELLPAYIVHGTNGSFIKDRADVQEDQLQSGGKPGHTDWGTEPETAKGILNQGTASQNSRTFINTEQGNYMEFYEGIYGAIVHEKSLPVTAIDGLNVMRVIEAVLESDRLKRVVELEKLA